MKDVLLKNFSFVVEKPIQTIGCVLLGYFIIDSVSSCSKTEPKETKNQTVVEEQTKEKSYVGEKNNNVLILTKEEFKQILREEFDDKTKYSEAQIVSENKKFKEEMKQKSRDMKKRMQKAYLQIMGDSLSKLHNIEYGVAKLYENQRDLSMGYSKLEKQFKDFLKVYSNLELEQYEFNKDQKEVNKKLLSSIEELNNKIQIIEKELSILKAQKKQIEKIEETNYSYNPQKYNSYSSKEEREKQFLSDIDKILNDE